MEEKVREGEIEVRVYKVELEEYLGSLEIIMEQTERRVLNNEKVEAKDKVYPYLRYIQTYWQRAKGRRFVGIRYS